MTLQGWTTYLTWILYLCSFLDKMREILSNMPRNSSVLADAIIEIKCHNEAHPPQSGRHTADRQTDKLKYENNFLHTERDKLEYPCAFKLNENTKVQLRTVFEAIKQRQTHTSRFRMCIDPALTKYGK